MVRQEGWKKPPHTIPPLRSAPSSAPAAQGPLRHLWEAVSGHGDLHGGADLASSHNYSLS